MNRLMQRRNFISYFYQLDLLTLTNPFIIAVAFLFVENFAAGKCNSEMEYCGVPIYLPYRFSFEYEKSEILIKVDQARVAEEKSASRHSFPPKI